MKLRSIDIFGMFGSRQHRHVTLSNENVTYIHSLNGVGKSTGMKIVYDIYNGDIQSLAGTSFDTATLEFDDGHTLMVTNGDSIDITMEYEGHVSSISDSDLKLMFSVTYLSAERNVVTMPNGRLFSAIDLMTSSFRTSFEKAAEDRVLLPYSGERKKRSVSEFIEWCREIDEQVSLIRSVNIVPNMPKDLSFPPTEEEYIVSRKEYDDLAYSLNNWAERHYQFAESIDLFLNIINRLFTMKKLIINENNQLMATMNTEDGVITLPLNRLSAGEKQLLIIFFRIIFVSEPGSLVILDEPEISLHVSWQQKLGSILIDIAQLRDLQMMIATHSPTIIHDRWDLASELRAERA